jgi:peptide/nickel transport system substrate-binding protein
LNEGEKAMKKASMMLFALLVITSLVLSACAAPTASAPQPTAATGGEAPAPTAASGGEAAAPTEAQPEPTAAPPTEPAAAGGTLTIAQAGEPGNLNPLIWATTSDTNVTHMIFDSVMRPDDQLNMVGGLAKEWTVSDDGLVYTFMLHDNVTWHDGQPFTANDVAFTFISLADPRYDAGAYSRVAPVKGATAFHDGEADSVEGIRVVDDTTIEFTLEEANASFLAQLFIGVVPQHILGDVSPAEWAKHPFNRAPVGTGPFKFVKAEAGQYIELAANKEYYLGAPKLDGVIVRFGDQNTMLAAFMNQEIDIVPVPVAEVANVKTLDFADVKASNDLSVFYVGFNLLNPHFKDAKVRQALAHATNKELIVTSVLGEFGYVMDDLFPKAHWSHNPDVTPYAYDLTKAQALLEEAGYAKNGQGIYTKDGQELAFTIEVPVGNKEREKTSVLIQQMWTELGVKVDVLQLDFPTLVTKLLPKDNGGAQRAVTADDYDAYILGFGVEADPDEYRPYFHTAFMPPNGYNFISYSDPAMDEMLEKQLVETDPAARQQIFFEIGKKLSDEVPWIALYGQNSVFVANTNVKGFSPDFRGVSFTAMEWSIAP